MDLKQLEQLYNETEGPWKSDLGKIHSELELWTRWNCDSLIRDGKWNDVLDKAQSRSVEDRREAEKYAEQLRLELLKMCDETLIKEPDAKSRQPLRRKIIQNQERFKDCPLKLVETIVDCVRQEKLLWKSYQDRQEAEISHMEVSSSDGSSHMGTCLSPANSTIDGSALLYNMELGSGVLSPAPSENLNLKTLYLKSNVDEVDVALEILKTTELNYCTDILHINELIHQLKQQKTKMLTKELHEIESKRNQICYDLKQCRQNLLQLLQKTFERADAIIPALEAEIITWKELQKLHYLRLSHDPLEELTSLAKQCADVGDALFTLIQKLAQCQDPPFWSEDLGDPVLRVKQLKYIQRYRADAEEKLKYLIKRSVVQTVQPPHIIQVTSTKSLPGTSKPFPAKIRVLALEKISMPIRTKISVEFMLESKLNGETTTKEITLDLFNGEAFLERNKSGVYESVVASFDSLQVRKFTRPKRARKKTATGPDQLFVCEQKFRLVFQGVFNIPNYLGDVSLRAVSLPVTVTTNSSQESDCTAALLWQCWNTSADNDNGPYIWPDRVAWPDVAAMLNKKMEKDTGKGLPEDQLLYLADKLNGGAPENGNYQDLNISWNQFAKEKMENHDFTFWKWFHASVNILEDHMKAEWNDGRIYGFLPKKKARELLLQCNPGVFLLRIGESYVSDSGPKITGAISPVVVRLRSKNGQFKKKVDFIEPYTLKELELHGTVGQILANTDADIKYLYPHMITREEAFKNYKSSKESRKTAQNDGYTQYIGRTILFKLDQLTLDNTFDDGEDDTEDDITPSEGPGSGSWTTYADTRTPLSDITCTSESGCPTEITPFSPDTRSIASPQQQQQIFVQPQQSTSLNANQMPRLVELLTSNQVSAPLTSSTSGIGSGNKLVEYSNDGAYTNDGGSNSVFMNIGFQGNGSTAVTSTNGLNDILPIGLDQNQPGEFIGSVGDLSENAVFLEVAKRIMSSDEHMSKFGFDCESWDSLTPTFDPSSPPLAE